MKPNINKIIEMCVQNGIEEGWTKSHKHLDNPSPATIKCNISHKIMEELYEYFSFGDEFV